MKFTKSKPLIKIALFATIWGYIVFTIFLNPESIVESKYYYLFGGFAILGPIAFIFELRGKHIGLKKLVVQVVIFSDHRPLVFVLVAIVSFFAFFLSVTIIFFNLGVRGPELSLIVLPILTLLTVFLSPLLIRSWLKVFGTKFELLEMIFYSIYSKRR